MLGNSHALDCETGCWPPLLPGQKHLYTRETEEQVLSFPLCLGGSERDRDTHWVNG